MFVLNENVEKINVEWDPSKIRAIAPCCEILENQTESSMNVLVSSEAEFIGFIYILQLHQNLNH